VRPIDGENCCGDACIPSDWPCCDNERDGGTYCRSSSSVCGRCPDEQTCYGENSDGTQFVTPYICCEDSVCPFVLSSGSVTLYSTLSPTPSSGAPSTASATSHRPGTTFVTLSAPPLITQPPSSMGQSTPSTPTKTTSHSSPRDSSSKTSSISYSSPRDSSSTTSVISLEFLTTSNTEALASYTTTSSSHSPLSLYGDSGPLLTGYCATYDYSLLSGPQSTALYYIPIVGCVGDKPDCCPFPVNTTTTSTVTKSITTSVTISTAGVVTVSVISTVTVEDSSPESTSFVFPTPESQAQVTLNRCPQDYETVSSGCCPS
jgi:hypothetical protein